MPETPPRQQEKAKSGSGGTMTQDWQPINTAPEATWVLVMVPNYGINIATMTRDPNVLGENGKFWFLRDQSDLYHPTHWMPLPPPPRPDPPVSASPEEP
jgi:hypothetical protein